MTKLEFIMKNSSYPLHSPLSWSTFSRRLVPALCSKKHYWESFLPSTIRLYNAVSSSHASPHITPAVPPVRSNDIEQGHSFPCKNPLPLTDNTFISLTVMYVMLQHCMLIAIRGYISFALYPAPKFSTGINKGRLMSICRKPYILTNACELNDVVRQMFCSMFCVHYFSFWEFE